ncbi:MAG: glycosyltransferase [Verrucomicrobia bacterium]|nr:glycosyltransferase [Verrucomicrobiota bacterium]
MDGVSVIIPAYNRANLIGETLESLLRQTLPALEILVVDDGSTDRTASVARSFGSPVRVIAQENAGPGAARNHGLREAKGTFLHFFDSDDIALPNKQEVQSAILAKTGADIAYGPWTKGFFEGREFFPENQVYQQTGLPKGDLVRALLSSWSVVPHACLFRREVVERAGGFPEDLRVGEDQLMFLRCLLAGARVVPSPDTLELYRLNNSDKLTASEEGLRNRIVEWGRFLLKAAELCRSPDREPEKWFGFRQRVSLTAREASAFNDEEARAVVKELRALYPRSWELPLRIFTWFGRKVAGLDKRLRGRRGSAAFCFGELTPGQRKGIAEAGYQLAGEGPLEKP